MIASLRKFVSLVAPADGRPRPLGKIVLRPETPEELEDLEDFCRHTGREMEGDRLEIAFFPKRPRPDGPAARTPEAADARTR